MFDFQYFIISIRSILPFKKGKRTFSYSKTWRVLHWRLNLAANQIGCIQFRDNKKRDRLCLESKLNLSINSKLCLSINSFNQCLPNGMNCNECASWCVCVYIVQPVVETHQIALYRNLFTVIYRLCLEYIFCLSCCRSKELRISYVMEHLIFYSSETSLYRFIVGVYFEIVEVKN